VFVVIGCALIPRFELVAATAGRRELLSRPVALAPAPDGPQVIGEASGAAEAFGVVAGMRLAEALGRCPALALIAPDPQRSEEAWERVLGGLEGIGAAVESTRPGEAFFEVEGLRGLWGRPERVLEKARAAAGPGARLGAGPTRLCALAAARAVRPRRGRAGVRVVSSREAGAFLGRLPVSVLRGRLRDEWTGINLADTLERLGVRTLGELAALPDPAVADRFGEPGLLALRMARGVEPQLRPRTVREELREALELPDAATGAQLERALELLVDRLLAHPARRGRSFRRLRIEARLAGGGGWWAEVVTRRPHADRARLLLVLRPKLAGLPAPACALALRARELGDEAPVQTALTALESERRRSRIAEAVRQARTVAGRGAVLKVLDVDPGSSVPERVATLAPFEPPAEP
jgi:protein ImuB